LSSRNRYSVGGRQGVVTAATADHCAAQLWNPHATVSIYVVEVHWTKTVATLDHPSLIRTSGRGATPNNTVTPDIDNHFNRRFAPVSGTVLELGTFGTQPTVAGPYLARTNLPAAIGAAWMYGFHDEPIEVPAGTGLAVATPVATAIQIGDATFVWDD
jgi:hypothetical protein